MTNSQPVNTPEIQESATTELEPESQPKKKKNYVLGAVLIAVLLIGLIAAYFLGQQNQDIRQQAATCQEQCPGSDGVLRNCTPPEADGTSEDSICNAAGRVESCGGSEYCCPEAGGAWTTDMTACTVDPSPSPSPTPEVSPSPSPSPSVSPTPEVSPSPEASPSPDASPTATPTTEPTVTYSCNSSCSSNSQCQSANSSYICYLSKCRLDSNPTSDQCAQSSSTTTQPELPAELPESGSEDILNWFKAGLGALGIGTVLLLLL